MSWDDYRVLLAFFRGGSLGAAAARLEVDKGTVSRRLTALEEDVGVTLVERERTGWKLTEEGQTVAKAAEIMEQAVEQAKVQVSGEGPRGLVELTAPVWFARSLLLPRLAEFRADYPDVELELLTTNAILDIGAREAQIGIRNVRPNEPNMVAKKLGTLGSGIYASPAYLRRAGAPTDRDELLEHTFVAFHDAVTYCSGLEFLDQGKVNIAFRASETEVLVDAVRGGVGIAALHCYLGDPDPALVRVVPGVYGTDTIYACFPEALRSLPRIRSVLNWLTDVWRRDSDALTGR